MSTLDPGVEEGIAQGADDVQADKPDYDHEQEEEEYLMQPTRWWFASTACPLLAGTFGPIASGFNICSLAYEWREYIPPGGNEAIAMQTGNTLKDPPWEIALNALSLCAAIVGNATLLLNMGHRLKFSTAQPITITGFLLAGVLLVADVAALAGHPHNYISQPEAIPNARHALTASFYFAAFAGVIYIMIGLLMCLTVYGANKGHYDKNFKLTPPQRTLMLQTMFFITYLLLGALVFSTIEGWAFVNAVYWADVTLLTVGLGDYYPTTSLGRGLLFPFSIGGILMVGLVVGSIRSLILERGKQKISARIVEKRRSKAIHNVDERKQTIKISYFAKADFSVDPALSPAQRREEEFNVMRKVQEVADRERRYFALATSAMSALVLWFAGAAVFQRAEYRRNWSYYEALYFSFTSLMTIGYGDYTPHSSAGKAFFVLWSLLAVPALTILISNMGDTIVQWFSDFSVAVASITVLPEDQGFRASLRHAVEKFMGWSRNTVSDMTLGGVLGTAPIKHEKRMDSAEYEYRLLDNLAGRLSKHLGDGQRPKTGSPDHNLEQDMLFYHYVLARECRGLQKDLHASPPQQYKWEEWEYYLKLMGNEEDPEDFPGQEKPDIMVPELLKAPTGLHPPADTAADRGHSGQSDQSPAPIHRYTSESGLSNSEKASSSSSSEDPPTQHLDGNVDRQTSLLQSKQQQKKPHRPRRQGEEPDYLRNWSWLSNQSPLMSTKTEAEWILERLSGALERELNRQRRGYKRRPPVSISDALRKPRGEKDGKGEGVKGEEGMDEKE